MFQQTFKNLDDIMFQEPGCNTELDYVEQSSWMLFLKYLDDLEDERAIEAQLIGEPYDFIFAEDYRWSAWAAPKQPDGKPDLDRTRIGADLIEFVNTDLMPYLRGFKQATADTGTIQYKIGEIFGEVRNKFQNGYMLRDALDRIDELTFGSQEQKHELSDLYETRIKNMGNAGRNGGQYYTPRPLIRAMIKVTDPRLGETIYDGAAGSAGFLCEAFEYMRPQAKSPGAWQTLQRETFYGKEQAPLAYVIGLMNMILHGIGAPNFLRTDTLAERIADIEEKDRYDVILAKAHARFDDPEWDGDPADVIVDPPRGPRPPAPPGEPGETEPPSGEGDPPPPPPPPMVEIELTNGRIISIAATTFWGPDGRPMSARDFIERMFGDLPDLFRDEDELRRLWSDPDTRKALLERLAERGYDALVLMQICEAILAEKSDLFDVLAYIAYATDPKTRAERARAGAEAVEREYDEKLAAFLNYVLGQYVDTGAEDLDRSKLPDYLRLHYGTYGQGAKALGGVERVVDSFVGFQKHLYS